MMQDAQNLRPERPDQCVVLIADDEVIVRNYVRRVLESDGYFTLTADNGEEALLISVQYSGPIHVLLSDVRMPIVNGLELREKIVLHRPQIRIILMSGESPAQLDVAFLRKPFGPKELKEKIQHILQASPFPPCGTAAVEQLSDDLQDGELGE